MHPETGDQPLRHIREHAVDFTFCNVADVYLDIRQGGSLEAVLQREARYENPAGFITKPSKPSSMAR